MCKRIEIAELHQKYTDLEGEKLQVMGWVRTIRASKTLGFIELNDGSSFRGLQIVYEEKNFSNFKEISSYSVGSAIAVEGTLVVTEGGRQAFEIQAASIQLLAPSSSSYPLQKKRHTLEYLRSIAHLRPRANTFGAVFRVRSAAAYAIHRFFQENGFFYVHTPIITAGDAEGAGELFQVTTLDCANPPRTSEQEVDYTKDFFGEKTALAVSGQLEAEAMAMGLGKVYTFGPTFRAENSNTTRHAAEFWMVEPEMAFADLQEDMDWAKRMIQSVLKYVMENCPHDMEFFNTHYDAGLLQRLQAIVETDFACMTYTEAVDILQKASHSFTYPVEWGVDLQTEHERYLTEQVVKKPLFVVDYPKEIKAFYMRQNDDKKTVAAMDLLVPDVGEIIGGSQREERLSYLLESMQRRKMLVQEYEWYLDLRRFGGVQHAGFGLGFERLIMYMTGVSNIRDVLPFPRTVGSVAF